MYSAFKEFYNLLSQVNSVYHDAALKLGLTDSELDILYSLNEHGSGLLHPAYCRVDRGFCGAGLFERNTTLT